MVILSDFVLTFHLPVFIYLMVLTTQRDRYYYYYSPFHKAGTERLRNLSKGTEIKWQSHQDLRQAVWRRAHASDLHTVWQQGLVCLAIRHIQLAPLTHGTPTFPFFLCSHPHFQHSTYQLTGFHETISSPRTESKQMDRGPRQFPHVWISGGTLSPICFYLVNGAKECGKTSVWIPEYYFRDKTLSPFPDLPSKLPTGLVLLFQSTICTVAHSHPEMKGYREIQWNVL